jgi:tetratricopeptide (TPR) repeat protein
LSGFGQNSSALRPDLDAPRLYQMARAAITAHQLEQAIDMLERVVCLQPDHFDARISLLHAHAAAGNSEDALRMVAELRARKPNDLMADFEEARLLSDMGQAERARELLEKVTREHPAYAPAWHSLARAARVAADDPLIGKIRERLASAAEHSINMMFLCMGLAKAYDDVGEYDLAFNFQERAKRQMPVTYNHEAEALRFAGLRDVFTRQFFARRQGYGVEDDRPVFIVGMPRSATSLTEQILASHPDVVGAGELDYMAMCQGEICSLTSDNAPLPRAVLKMSAEASTIFARRYLRRLARHDQAHRRVVDKMPHNFLNIGLISLLLPRATIINCQREPIDVCLSIFMQLFSKEHGYAHSLEGLGRYYQLYARLMDHWREHAPVSILDSVYADLIADQRGQSERLAAHVGLAWNESMMAFHQTERRVATPSRAQVRQPLHARSKERWRNYAHRLQPLIEALGPYAPTA